MCGGGVCGLRFTAGRSRARSKGKSCFLSNTVASPWLSETSKQMCFSFEDDTKVKREGHVHMRRGAGKSPRVRRPFQDSAVRGEEMKAAAAACGGVRRRPSGREAAATRRVSEHQDAAAAASGSVRFYFSSGFKEGAGPPAAPPPLSPDQSEKVYLLLATRTSSATLKTPDLMKLSSR